jgi:hypothetical protein
MSYVLVLLIAIGVMVVFVELVLTSPLGVPLPVLLYPRGDEVIRKVTELVTT